MKRRLAFLVWALVAGCGGSGAGTAMGDDAVEAAAGDLATLEVADEVADDDSSPDTTTPDPSPDVVGEDAAPESTPLSDAADADDGTGQDPGDWYDVSSICPQAVPFQPGPYGTKPRDLAGPFTTDSLGGPFDFQSAWNGCESTLFLQYAANSTFATALWKSFNADFLQAAPADLHIVWQTNDIKAPTEMAAQKDAVDKVLAGLDEEARERWTVRMHYLTVPTGKQTGWDHDEMDGNPIYAFAVDHFQRMRQVGVLYDPTGLITSPDFKHVGYEVRHLEFEWQRELALQAEGATVVPVCMPDAACGDQDVVLPDAATMAGFDTLEVDVGLYCKGHLDGNCPEWDRIGNLSLCAVDAPDQCPEIARWITTYHREARWVTDISGMLALMADGGTRRLKVNAGDAFDVELSLRLSNRGKGRRPFAAIPLWTGGGFNADYNAAHAPITFEPPEGTKHAELYALITGHGWGTDQANCAEFCNHTHHFQLNGMPEFVKEHPEAGTGDGCAKKVDQGVIPNQYGTWPLGRGGWCPGLDVAPFTADLTEGLVSGANTLTYRALYQGKDYVPVPASNPNGQGFPAEIQMTSYLVFWK